MTTFSNDADALRAREDLGAKVRAQFMAEGFTPVETPVLQPADVFLDRSGEDIRRRTYLFVDPGGAELCLRPELTIPVCRHYLAADPAGANPAKLCSAGTVYRYQPTGSEKLNEFNQSGIELLGDAGAADADALVMASAVRAVEAAGLTSYEIRMGDLALYGALIDALDIPAGWKARLRRQFWRPQAFRAMLAGLAAGEPQTSSDSTGLLSVLADMDEAGAVALLEDVLKLGGIAPVGGRGTGEIAARLLEKAGDAAARKMPTEAAKLIAAFMDVSGTPAAALAEIEKLARSASLDLSEATGNVNRRLEMLAKAGLDLSGATFATGFGRRIEYYTGHVFELVVPSLGQDEVIAGGGRYDGLLQSLGAERDVPAVGCAIGLERLARAVKGAAS